MDIVEGGVNGDIFYSYVEKFLLSNLMAFDGQNPHSIVILDNSAIHNIQEIIQMICNLGTLIHFLPPYSPDYNPIEYMFSKLKQTLRAMDTVLLLQNSFSQFLHVLCSRFFMRTSAACPGGNSRWEVLLPVVVGVEGEELVVFGQIALANAVAASTRAVLSVSCFCCLGCGAPVIKGTCGSSSTTS